ncbi:unnamed protein product [Leptosia nina]|uniref:Uncharacterized protein n=1 Tax=Leptosia nina TaxID=320188 RepID=A0AAV1JFV2_9NEOP
MFLGSMILAYSVEQSGLHKRLALWAIRAIGYSHYKTYPNAPEYLSFPKFSAFALPYMFLMEAAMYLYLVIVYLGFLRPKSDAAQRSKLTASGIEAAKKVVNEDYNNLVKCNRSSIICSIGDSAAAMLVAFLMYLLPSTLNFFNNCRAKVYEDLPKHPIPSVLQWKTMNDIMPYSFMFLLGGGFALSEAAKEEYTDLNGKIGAVLSDFRYLGNGTILLLIIMFTVFITNFASNVAVCNVITPIVMQLAKEINQNPLWYNIAAGYSSSYAFCLPVGTPGNLVVQSVANIPTTKMIKAGFGPTISTIIISWICIYVWAPVIWPDLLLHPDWIENTRTQFN